MGADDGIPQSDPELNSGSASDESIDSNEASKLSSEGDPRSSTDGSVRPRRASIERFERVIQEDTSPSAPDSTPEALDSEFIKLGLGSSKKPKRKSKVSAARSAFEED